nr:restriction endonuclease subunit S [uncultured Flavobacterium sp.]
MRFPEFKNEGEWKESLLGSEAEIKGRIGYRGYTVADIVEKGKGAITLSPSNFDENGRLKFEKCTYITWKKYEESPEIMLEVGQTVLVKTASVGKTAYVESLPEKATVNPQIVVLKPKKIFNRFLANSVAHQNTQIQINNCVGAGAIPNISQEIISKLKILVPPDKERKEQEKIASCLSSLDEVITAQIQKLDLLKDQKKGLMQNLFPQEGEKVPKFRFKEFENDGDWVEKSFENLFEIGNGRDYKHLDKGEIPVYGSGGYMLSVDEYLYDGESVCIGRKGTIDKPMFLNGKFWTVDTLFYTHLFKNSLPKYIFYVFENINWREHNEAGGIPSLSKTNIYKIKVLVPPNNNLEEQKKIASCFSSIDTLIAAQVEKIEKLKWHKKGLMQGLFPKIID